jgi:hypothetical protein
MQYESDAVQPADQNLSTTTPRYSLELFSWGIGEDLIDRQVVFFQEPLTWTDLSLPQLMTTLHLHNQNLDFDQDWLRRDGLLCSGLPEPDSLVHSEITAQVVSTIHWPRALMKLKLSYDQADMLNQRWSIETLLYGLYRATRISQSDPHELALLKEVDLCVEPISWQQRPEDIICDQIPWSASAVPSWKPIQLTEIAGRKFYSNQFWGVFGYETNSGIELCVYDTDRQFHVRHGSQVARRLDHPE